MIKTIISWIIALAVAAFCLHLIFAALGFAFELMLKLIVLIPLIIIAFPFYLIIRKKFIK
jgi:hypothetical protein